MDRRKTPPESSGSNLNNPRKAFELGGESDKPTREEKGKGKEIDHPSKRKRDPDHIYQELKCRCLEMDSRDFGKVLFKAQKTLTASRDQATKDFDSQGMQDLAIPLSAKVSAYNNALLLFKQIETTKGEDDNMRREMLKLIESSRDLKNKQAKGQQLNVEENVIVKTAEAFEDAILNLPNLYSFETYRLKPKADKLKSDNMRLEAKNEKLVQTFIIEDMNEFLQRLRQCGKQFYDVSAVKEDRDVQIALNTYSAVKDAVKKTSKYTLPTVLVGLLRLENGTPEFTSKKTNVNREAWSPLAQDMGLLAWIHAERKVDGGPEARKKTTNRTEFHFVLPFTKENLWDEKDNRMTLMAREAIQLLTSGYEIRNRSPELNEGNAGVVSFGKDAVKTYSYAICVDVVRAQMASLLKFKEGVEMYEVKRDKDETDENFKRRIKETKEALWKLFSSVLEPEKDKGVVAGASQAKGMDTPGSVLEPGKDKGVVAEASQAKAARHEATKPRGRPKRKRFYDTAFVIEQGESSLQTGLTQGDRGKGREIENIDYPSKRRKVETRNPDHAYKELEFRCKEMDSEDLKDVFSNVRKALITSQNQVTKDAHLNPTQQINEFDTHYPSLILPKIAVFAETSRQVKQGETNALKKAFSGLPGVVQTTTSQSQGGSWIHVSYKFGTELYKARQELVEQLNQTQSSLPENMRSYCTILPSQFTGLAGPEADTIKEILSLIKSSRDLKNKQAEGQQLNVKENGIVKAAEAFEDAIWGLAEHHQHENEQIKATIEWLRAQNKNLETANERLAQKYIIGKKSEFVQSAKECGKEFYNGPIMSKDPATERAYNMYKKGKQGPNHGLVILGRVKEEDTQPLPSNESEPYMDAAANASFLLTDDDMSKPTGSIMGLKKDVFTVFSNDGWILGTVHAENQDPGERRIWVRPEDRATSRTEFHFASPFTKKNLWDEEEGRITLMAREAIQLLSAGYQIRNRDPKLSDEGIAGVKSLEKYPYKTYPYAICLDAVKADMATLPKFKEAVEKYQAERKEGETQEEYKKRMKWDEDLKGRIKEIKEALWKLFDSVLVPENEADQKIALFGIGEWSKAYTQAMEQ